MSILDSLITDRTATDVARVKALSQKGFAAMTAAEKAEYLQPMKGAYNATDLNRVQEACEYVANRLHQYGYAVDVQKIPHQRGGGTPRLPEGYTELTYIENTALQYINTGVSWSNDVSFHLKWQYTTLLGYSSILGVQGASGNLIVREQSGALNFFHGVGASSVMATISAGQVLDLYASADGGAFDYDLTVNGTANYTGSGADSGNSAGSTIFLFDSNLGGGQRGSSAEPSIAARAKLYEFDIDVNGETVRSFVPCINPLNEIGLYDLITEQFFGNAGTGAFVAGEVVPFPVIVDYTWIMSDIPTAEEMSIYIQNIHNLRDALSVVAPSAPEDAESMTHQDANAIEQILMLLDASVTRMTYAFRHSGTFYSNMGGLFL